MSCRKLVYSGNAWDIHGHRCGRKEFKDGLCKLHQPEAVKARQEKRLSTYRSRMSLRMRQATNTAHAPTLADALRLALTALSFNGGVTQYRSLAARARHAAAKALSSYDADMKRYKD